MALDFFLFGVHYSGWFSRQFGCTYVLGDVGMYDELYDLNCLSFFELEIVVKPFGYKAGDLIYYKQPTKNLDEGLQLVLSNHDVLEMVKCHEGESVIVLYVVSFDDSGVGTNIDEEAVQPMSKEGETSFGTTLTKIVPDHLQFEVSPHLVEMLDIRQRDRGDDDGHRHLRKGKAPMKETVQQESEESEGNGSDMARSDVLASPVVIDVVEVNMFILNYKRTEKGQILGLRNNMDTSNDQAYNYSIHISHGLLYVPYINYVLWD
ncbi:hypothetical protein CJ030_MR4G024554 [Morella rubra]|uniref:PB1-like domain-containing protein n=1 Tax=Morella rubra TaxID=262757 RepID=A0A6A1VSX3_9ROSI|nr:hypothetical protein CJ030_MR4G024554 [Morella rubra]